MRHEDDDDEGTGQHRDESQRLVLLDEVQPGMHPYESDVQRKDSQHRASHCRWNLIFKAHQRRKIEILQPDYALTFFAGGGDHVPSMIEGAFSVGQ